jgi:eukaryotic-like serine/threonine-protein kinase
MESFDLSNIDAPEAIKSSLSVISDKYVIQKSLEGGANGFVFVGHNIILEVRVAIKFYYWGGDQKRNFEPKAFLQIESPHVLKVFDAGYVDDEWAYFITPLCSDGNLDNLIQEGPLGTLRAVDLCRNVLMGLSALHAKRFLHRDIKPANIYVHNGIAVIGDFGSLVELPQSSTQVSASLHAALYVPPESIKSGTYSVQGDIYQCGLVFYQLLGGKLPYDEDYWMDIKQIRKYKALTYPDNAIYA